MSSKRFKKSLQNESRESVLTKFCDFIDKFNAHQLLDGDEANENLEQLISTIDLNDAYSLSHELVEHADLLELVQTSGHFKLNSIIMVLFELTSSMQELSKDALQFVRQISFYGNNQQSNEDASLNEIAKLIGVLFDLVCYLRRCNELGVNFFLQLTSMYYVSKEKNANANERVMVRFKDSRLDQLFDAFQSLTVSIINLEEVVRCNQKLKKDFFSYKKVIEFINLNEAKFELDEAKKKEMDFLLSLIFKIELELFDSSWFFVNFYLSILKAFFARGDLLSNSIVQNHFTSYIKYKLNEFEASKFIPLKQWLGVCSVFVICVHLFNKDDRGWARSSWRPRRDWLPSFI